MALLQPDDGSAGTPPLRLAAARLTADYVSRAVTWAGDVDRALAADLEEVHRRIVAGIDEMLAGRDDDRDIP